METLEIQHSPRAGRTELMRVACRSLIEAGLQWSDKWLLSPGRVGLYCRQNHMIYSRVTEWPDWKRRQEGIVEIGFCAWVEKDLRSDFWRSPLLGQQTCDSGEIAASAVGRGDQSRQVQLELPAVAGYVVHRSEGLVDFNRIAGFRRPAVFNEPEVRPRGRRPTRVRGDRRRGDHSAPAIEDHDDR